MPQSLTQLFQVPPSVTRQVIRVRLESGELVERDPADLIALPAEMTLPLADQVGPA